MRINYMFRYSWKALWNKQDRIFSILNLICVTGAIIILVSLSGILYSFKKYTENILNKLPLRIDIFKSKDTLVENINKLEPQILKLEGVVSLYKRVPTFLTFIQANNIPLPLGSTPLGSTILPQEPYIIKDINNNPIKFLSKKVLKTPYDEIGIIVSFNFIKKLGYLPLKASPFNKKSWKQKELPKKIKIIVRDIKDNSETILPIPVIGVTPILERGDYLITEDFYNIILNWRTPFQYMLKDRYGKRLVEPKLKITKAYYVLTEDQNFWLEDHYDMLEDYSDKLGVQIYLETWDTEEKFEYRLVISAYDSETYLTKQIISQIDKILRKKPELKNLPKYKIEGEKPIIRDWKDFPKITYNHQYMQASIYVRDKKYIRPVLEKLRSMGLFASSSLERYLKMFEKQEKLFLLITFSIFGLVLLLSGIVLFSTFYTNVLRKRKEIGIFKAYGASKLLVFTLFYIQTTIIVGLAGIIGIVLGERIGTFLTNLINKIAHFSTKSKLIYYLPEQYFLILIGIVLFVSWIAIGIPAKIAVSIAPSEIVRN